MTVGLGLIGCGTHARHHAANCGSMASVIAIWDPDPDAMNKLPGVTQHDSLESLLENEWCSAVLICSPDEYHLEQIEMALRAGKHVFCEKPLMVPGQEIERLEAAFALARSKKLVLTSCHPRRYDRPIWWLHDKVSLRSENPVFIERFGRVVSFDFDFSYHKPSNRWKHDRSLLLDHLNHEVDLMNCLFDIQGFDAWKLHDAFDRYEVVGRRDDGIAFHFSGTRRLEEHTYPEWCRVRFERGEVELDMMQGIARIIDHDNKSVETVPDLSISYDDRLRRVMTDFADCQITWGQTGYLSEAEMLMNTEAGIVLAANEGIQRINVRS